MSFATHMALNILNDTRCIGWVISQYFFFFQIKNLVSLHLHEAQRRQHGGDHQDPRRVGRHSLFSIFLKIREIVMGRVLVGLFHNICFIFMKRNDDNTGWIIKIPDVLAVTASFQTF